MKSFGTKENLAELHDLLETDAIPRSAAKMLLPVPLKILLEQSFLQFSVKFIFVFKAQSF